MYVVLDFCKVNSLTHRSARIVCSYSGQETHSLCIHVCSLQQTLYILHMHRIHCIHNICTVDIVYLAYAQKTLYTLHTYGRQLLQMYSILHMYKRHCLSYICTMDNHIVYLTHALWMLQMCLTYLQQTLYILHTLIRGPELIY